jgi:DNA-binding GntR family transcriptional regulator
MVYCRIRDSIILGELSPGEKVVEEEVADILGVSRTPVRAAFERLKKENLLCRQNGGFTYVTGWDTATIWELITLRAALEGLALTLAARKLLQGDFDQLENIITQMEEATELDDYYQLYELDLQFHSFIWSHTGHKLLERYLDTLRTQIRYYMYIKGRKSRTMATDHRKLVNLLRDRRYSEMSDVLLEHISPSLSQQLKNEVIQVFRIPP